MAETPSTSGKSKVTAQPAAAAPAPQPGNNRAMRPHLAPAALPRLRALEASPSSCGWERRRRQVLGHQFTVSKPLLAACEQHHSARPALPVRLQRSSPGAPWRPLSQTHREPTAGLQGLGEATAAVATETSKQIQLRRAAAASTHLRAEQQFAMSDKINRAGPPYHAACPAGTRFSDCFPGTRCAAWA